MENYLEIEDYLYATQNLYLYGQTILFFMYLVLLLKGSKIRLRKIIKCHIFFFFTCTKNNFLKL